MAPLQLQFLGSGDAFGSGGRFQAGLQLSNARGTLLLDCGASSLIAMKQAGVDAADIDAVRISHLHGDHFGGLPFLILDAQFRRRERPLTIAGPLGIEERVRAAQDVLFPGSAKAKRRFEVRYVELEERVPTEVGIAFVTAFPAEHSSGAPSLALRPEVDGRRIAYSGDSAWTDALVEAARGADCFVCESYSFEKSVKFHLSHTTLAGKREMFDCDRIILTHMSEEMLARVDEAVFEVAHDGMVVTL